MSAKDSSSSLYDAMRRANATAESELSTEALDRPVAPCAKLWYVIEATVVGEDDKPLSGQAIHLVKQDGQVFSKQTNRDGTARFEALEESSYKLSLYKLDKDAWRLTNSAPLPDDRKQSQASANWIAAPEQIEHATHPVEQGDCIASIANLHGFFPQTLEEHNADLKRKRGSLNILYPGDTFHIPPKRYKTIDVTVGNAYRLTRAGVPEMLRIRFLGLDQTPRAGLLYLVEIEAAGGQVAKNLHGETDAKGFLSEAIPPDATAAHVTLNPGLDEEVYTFDLGKLDPIDTVTGVQGRLNALGYDCGEEDGQLNDRTRAALERFQREQGLSQIGELDQKTRDELQNLYLS